MAGPMRHWTTPVHLELRPGFGDFHICCIIFYALAQGNGFNTKEPRYVCCRSGNSSQLKCLSFKLTIKSIAIIWIIIYHSFGINLYRHLHYCVIFIIRCSDVSYWKKLCELDSCQSYMWGAGWLLDRHWVRTWTTFHPNDTQLHSW